MTHQVPGAREPILLLRIGGAEVGEYFFKFIFGLKNMIEHAKRLKLLVKFGALIAKEPRLDSFASMMR